LRAPTFARDARARRILSSLFMLAPAPALAFSFAFALAFVMMACGEKAEKPPAFKPNAGQIQVLNGSGRAGQVEAFRDYLVGRGFDVIETGNARDWNHEYTLVLARTRFDTIARAVAEALGTDRVVHLQNSASLVEATVIIGKDYKELMRKWPQDTARKAK
jgi:hypothetical protein